MPLPHLDRPFDYLVPEDLDAVAEPGVRVRVRFSGQLVDGFLLDRADRSAHEGKLAFLERVVSPQPVLDPEIVGLARAVADRYAGTMADVLRLAVPPRHARAESAAAPAPVDPVPASPAADRVDRAHAASGAAPGRTAGQATSDRAAREQTAPDRAAPEQVTPAGPASGGWDAYSTGPAFLRALRDGRSPRAVFGAMPGEDWPARYAEAAAATAAGGRGALILVADARDLDRVDAALTRTLGAGRHVALSAALGPAERYRRFLAAARGEVTVVAGTRAAAFVPVTRLGLVAIWDDGDDLYAEPRSPYPHAREVLLIRAHRTGTAALLGGFARSVEAQQLLETGWAREIVADRDRLRGRSPAVTAVGDDAELARDPAAAGARLPTVAWKAARDALAAGAPVLVQVPRRGYLPAVCCVRCRNPARCPTCHGPLALSTAASVAGCRWCGRVAAGYTCPVCGARGLRAAVVGARRTAEELGRVFPDVPVRTSGRDGVLASVPDGPGLVITTPGAEPVPDGPGYGAVLLLDTWAMLTRADLRAGEEALRRWAAAAGLARPASDGGRVVVVADAALAPVQALIRWQPGWLAARELAERRELGFPPAVRLATVTGSPAAVSDLLSVAHLPDSATVLGPVPHGDDGHRVLVRTGRGAGRDLAAALHAATAARTARKVTDPVRIQVDPLDLL